ncbi:MAG: hypothetical protein GEV11_06280 [Streptosporangiales bacterium]|nr:hypothetical protein [Streptosporangiales bacterium]
MLGVAIAFIGALVAWVAAGALIGRAFRDRRLFLLGWAGAGLGLAAALGAQAVGYVVGFGPALFRAIQIGASLLAPLWLAWGAAELVIRQIQGRFAARLLVVALTLVPGVTLALDPLKGTFGTEYPSLGDHYQIVPRYALMGVHAVAVVALVGLTLAVAMRVRSGDEVAWPQAIAVSLASLGGVLAVISARFSLGAIAPLLLLVAACLLWYAAIQATAEVAERGRRGRRAADRRSDDYKYDDDYYDEYDYEDEHPPRRREGLDTDAVPVAPAPPGHPGQHGPRPAGGPMGNGVPEGAAFPPAPAGPAKLSDYVAAASAPPAGQGESLSPDLYGMIAVFTLQDGHGEPFDRLAEQVVDDVRRSEPDTLIFACHHVPSAPMQRIFYQLYRDRVAYEEHERKPYVQRFLEERQAHVLATNVIELKMTSAKVSPALLGALTVRP